VADAGRGGPPANEASLLRRPLGISRRGQPSVVRVPAVGSIFAQPTLTEHQAQHDPRSPLCR
jgi:hypothetical protein